MGLFGTGGAGGIGGGGGIPPHDLTTFTSQSTEEGILLSFSGPEPTYLPDADGQPVFAAAPRGIMIRYSTEGYPLKETDGVFGYNYNPEGEDWDGSGTHTCTIVGLTKDTKYYFTAFPYSDYGVYNRSESAKNRTEMTWVGNKGTISVNVQPPDGYLWAIGEYTITLVDQASSSPQNIEKTVTGAGVTQFSGLEGGKSYKVRLSSIDDLQAPPDSEVIEVVAGANKDITMKYALLYGTITVNVSVKPAGVSIGAYTVTLTPQGGGEAKTAQGNNAQAVTFSNCENGTVYTVALSSINHYTANVGGKVTAVGGKNISHNVSYSFSATLNSLTWEEIDNYGQMGVAEELFSVGDTKDDVVSGETLTFEILGFGHDDLASESGKANYTFGTKNCMAATREMGAKRQNYWEGVNYKNSDVFTWLEELYTGLPSDMKNAIKTVSKKVIQDGSHENSIKSYNVHLFLFAGAEIFDSNDLYDTTYEELASTQEGSRYSIFTTSNSRIKKLSNGNGNATPWWLRSPDIGSLVDYCYVDENGKIKFESWSNAYGICFGFCI